MLSIWGWAANAHPTPKLILHVTVLELILGEGRCSLRFCDYWLYGEVVLYTPMWLYTNRYDVCAPTQQASHVHVVMYIPAVTMQALIIPLALVLLVAVL